MAHFIGREFNRISLARASLYLHVKVRAQSRKPKVIALMATNVLNGETQSAIVSIRPVDCVVFKCFA
jgi:hypothetical protein